MEEAACIFENAARLLRTNAALDVSLLETTLQTLRVTTLVHNRLTVDIKARVLRLAYPGGIRSYGKYQRQAMAFCGKRDWRECQSAWQRISPMM